MELFQHTITKAITLSGEGVISGKEILLELCPAPPNHGIVFERADLPSPISIPVGPETAHAIDGASLVALGKYRIIYVEHLLSALNGLSIDNILIKVYGDEIPLFDGSAKAFVEAIISVGRQPQWALRRYVRLEEEIIVREGEKSIVISPADTLAIDYEIDFAHPVIGHQKFSFELSQEKYVSQVCMARTFAFLEDLAVLREKGLLRGGSLENALVLDDKQVLNPDGLHFPDEFVRHKTLDLLGDLYLFGAPILAKIKATRASHKLHLRAVKALGESLYAWRWYPSPGRAPLKPAAVSLPAFAA
ncbi:UDP-3-O-acyl-N-acetylglucosamine deacetylase [Thermodesulfatator atlanticus]|uniref:UDP-3-O-acyl-N-acetylglucosamine deacetylase n=1 Tax=Thermodesulfatator atlanticus TaxID=501497 RepID=UPI0003B57894|nr:UDP-3-O-acyl-N-acetylglucosamine deacetylase [Thermodesulfatator atlanticus]